MELANLVKPTALFAALGVPMSAQAATILNVDYSASSNGTAIKIGAVASPQYTFGTDGYKSYINANGTNRIGFPGSPADQTSVTTSPVFGAATNGNYNLAFFIGSTAYTGTATVDSNGQHISRISYDLANPAAVPEAATWAMMIGGLGLTGAAMRRRRQAGSVATA